MMLQAGLNTPAKINIQNKVNIQERGIQGIENLLENHVMKNIIMKNRIMKTPMIENLIMENHVMHVLKLMGLAIDDQVENTRHYYTESR
jgi:hypothetical protein